MDRRKFVKDTSLFTIGMAAYGNISWAHDRYIGNTITTTDILGPFYRPDAPFRTNLNPSNFKGDELHLFGTILKKDGKTPMKNCLLEIWQCKADGNYDNTTDDYTYRASQRTNKKGAYSFVTTIPVPEPVDEKMTVFRPAHIHLRVSAENQQDLITQIYFHGDPHLATDPSTKSELAINRILTVKQVADKKQKIQFDVTLENQYIPEDSVYHRISGIYKMSDGSMMEFYRDSDLLFYKTNNQIWGGLGYSGDNTFGSKDQDTQAKFQLLQDGGVKVSFRFSRRRETKIEGTKYLAYKKQ